VTQANPKLESLLRLLDARGLNGAIVYSEGICSILAPSYLHYFSECRLLGPRNAAVVSKSGAVAMLIDPSWDAPRVAGRSWIQDVRGSRNFTRDLASLMRELKATGRVGIAGSKEITGAIHAAASEAAELVPADDLIEEMARRKTAREMEVVYDTARIADVGFTAMVASSRPGVREYELVAEMECAMRAAGADDNFVLISSGPHNREMHEPTDRRLSAGDIIIGEITPVRDGQFVQLCRTVVLGEPKPVLREKYDLLLQSFEASLKEVRSGAEASLMVKTMNRVLSEAGYGKYCYPPFMRARGHGFGSGSIAPGGAVDEATRTRFEAQQVVVVHPNQYLPETGYLACGETFLVTQSGAERLARTETKLYVREI
jgi:Xaa-Pro dipeptidase